MRNRLLFNRMSVLPSWDPMEPSVWVKTGNELGDMIYQDVITETNRPTNRTPILEGGFRTPAFKGFGMMGGYSGNYIRVTRPYDPGKVNTIEDIIL